MGTRRPSGHRLDYHLFCLEKWDNKCSKGTPIVEKKKMFQFVYFCALFPYFLIAVLLLRGLTLPGAWTGVYNYLKPNMTRLADTTVWKDAGTQVRSFLFA